MVEIMLNDGNEQSSVEEKDLPPRKPIKPTIFGSDSRVSVQSKSYRSPLDVIARSSPLMIAGFGFILLFSLVTIGRLVDPLMQSVVALTSLLVIISGITLEAYGYLQSVKEKNQEFILSRSTLARDDKKDLLKWLEQQKLNESAGISPADKQMVLEKAVKSLTDDAAARIASEWESKYKAEALDEQYIKRIRGISDLIQARLRNEIEALGRRANVNLALGMFISLAGTAVLGWFVYTTSNEFHSNTNLSEIGAKFGIRFSLALVIQIFAYFFLRLYRYSIFEIKYFQNEITSAEFRLIALEAGLKTGDKKIIEKLCSDMSKTERNFILKKGETTLALARDAIEREYDQAFLPASRAAGAKPAESAS